MLRPENALAVQNNEAWRLGKADAIDAIQLTYKKVLSP